MASPFHVVSSALTTLQAALPQRVSVSARDPALLPRVTRRTLQAMLAQTRIAAFASDDTVRECSSDTPLALLVRRLVGLPR